MAGKADIVNRLRKRRGISKKQAADAFEVIIASISKSLKKGERVKVPGFGSFAVSKRDARQGRNPATGATIKIKATKSVRFKIGKDLKDKRQQDFSGSRRSRRSARVKTLRLRASCRVLCFQGLPQGRRRLYPRRAARRG